MPTTELTHGDPPAPVPTLESAAKTIGARRADYELRMLREFVCTGLAGVAVLAAVAGALFAFPTPHNRAEAVVHAIERVP